MRNFLFVENYLYLYKILISLVEEAKMKKLTSVFYMYFGAGCAIFAVLMMFTPFLKVDGSVVNATKVFWNSGANTISGAWMSFVGFMLVLISGLVLFVLALPFSQPSAKVEKIVLISSLALLVIGLILVGGIALFYGSMNPVEVSSIVLYPGYYLFLVAAVLAIACNLMALVLDW